MHEGRSAADLLADARAHSGLTVSQWASRSGVSRALLHGYLAGRHQPSLPQLDRLLRAAGQRLHVEVRPVAAWRDPAPSDRPKLSKQERGRALLDALTIADAVPVRRRTELRFPPWRELVRR